MVFAAAEVALIEEIGEFEHVQFVETEKIQEKRLAKGFVIIGVFDQAEEGQQFADLQVLENVLAGPEFERNAQFEQQFGQFLGLGVSMVENGDLSGVGAGRDQAFDLFGGAVDFGLLGGVAVEFHGRGGVAGVALQVFVDVVQVAGDARAIAGDHLSGGVEDGLLAAVIADQGDQFQFGGIVTIEIDDVFDGGSLEAIDRLVVVTDHKDIGRFKKIAEQIDGAVLCRIGVLVFVDQNVLVNFLIFAQQGGGIFQFAHGHHDHVLIVIAAGFSEVFAVKSVGAGQLALFGQMIQAVQNQLAQGVAQFFAGGIVLAFFAA